MRLSATRIKTYLMCPRQFCYRYIRCLPPVPSAALIFGRVIHQTLHLMHLESKVRGQSFRLESSLALFQTLWSEALGEDASPIINAEAEAKYQALARRILERYVAMATPGAQPLLMEFPFEIACGDHVLCGVIDRLEAGAVGLIVVDYKTGQRKPKAQEVAVDLQLTIYAYAVEQLFNLPVERVTYLHLRDCTPLSASRGPDDYRHLLHEVLPHVATGIEANLFPPLFGYWCNYCEYRAECQAEGRP